MEDAEVIYRDATALDLVDDGYVWIVTEQALLPPNTPTGWVLVNIGNDWQQLLGLALLQSVSESRITTSVKLFGTCRPVCRPDCLTYPAVNKN